MKILHVPYHQINKSQWDQCILNASNTLIYAESVYLDMMAETWDALILNDYEAVMPLTWRRKWGVRYLYQPAFIQQSGIFHRVPLSTEIIHAFYSAAIKFAGFAEISINYSEFGYKHSEIVSVQQRTNYLMPLGKGYPTIESNYSPYILQRLNRLRKFEMNFRKEPLIRETILRYHNLYGSRIPQTQQKDFSNFEKLCVQLNLQNRVITRQVYNKEGTEILAAVLLLKDKNRIYNILSCISPNGKTFLANYFLYDALFREFGNENILFDFEGSDIKGIAYFYEKFASTNQPYGFLKYNRLPRLLKLIKS